MTKSRKTKASAAPAEPPLDDIALILRDSYRLHRWDRLSRCAFRAAAPTAEKAPAPAPRKRAKAAGADVPAPVEWSGATERSRARRAA